MTVTNDYIISDNIKVDNRYNRLFNYPYYRPGGTSPFIQLSIAIYDIFAIGATLVFYEVEPYMFRQIPDGLYRSNNIEELIAFNPHIIAV